MSESNNDELKHYGVLGMKWGVHRAIKKLTKARSSGNKEKEEKAIASLNKHKGKINKKLEKLGKESDALSKKKFKIDTKTQPRIAKLDRDIAYYQNKANKTWSEGKQEKYSSKANKLTLEVNQLKAKTEQIKASIAKNEALTRTFSSTLSDIDNLLVTKGKKYVISKRR